MKLLKDKRLAKNLTQSKLGLIIGIKGNTICQYESGQREPSIDILKKLSKVFNCTIDEIIG